MAQTYAPPVLVFRLLSRSRVTTLLAVPTFALLTAAAAEIAIPLPFTPVPLTGQTFAVLLAGAALGWRAGAASQLLYVALGAIGLPYYAEDKGGWEVVTGATGGYLVGFIAAAAVVGWLAERKHDRRFNTTLAAFVIGSFVIYAFGAAGLMWRAGMDVNEAILLGVVPFVFGDVLKAAAAGALLPATWRLVGDR